jgi:hypothetical protein
MAQVTSDFQVKLQTNALRRALNRNLTAPAPKVKMSRKELDIAREHTF